MGTHRGQTICAKIRNIYVESFSIEAKSGLDNDNHTNPSVNCWMAKIRGILAKGICDEHCDFFIVATPIIERMALAPKLAPAEKHIGSRKIIFYLWAI
jgi:hypothetical protein